MAIKAALSLSSLHHRLQRRYLVLLQADAACLNTSHVTATAEPEPASPCMSISRNGRVVTSHRLIYNYDYHRGRSCYCCYYHTNGDILKRDDPYHILGLRYGDVSTITEIKDAYRKRASILHPDINRVDTPIVAQRKFQQLQKAYNILMNVHSNLSSSNGEYSSSERTDEWRYSIWRNGDRIALDRTDVAGVMKKRPAPPATKGEAFRSAQIGHPDGRGMTQKRRAEYLPNNVDNTDGGKASAAARRTAYARGSNKWVEPKQFKPWDGSTKSKKASDFVLTTSETDSKPPSAM